LSRERGTENLQYASTRSSYLMSAEVLRVVLSIKVTNSGRILSALTILL